MKNRTTTIGIALLTLAAAYGAAAHTLPYRDTKAEDQTQVSELPAHTCAVHTVNSLPSLVDYLTAPGFLIDTLDADHRYQVEVSV
jgi:hypothetical protein